MSEQVQSISPSVESLGELRGEVAGTVIGPGDASYDGARRSFNALVDRRPAVIVRCFGAGDVATAFDYARTQGLEIAVRGGGHNPAGHCVLDGGLVIDLSLMRRVDVDGEAGPPGPRRRHLARLRHGDAGLRPGHSGWRGGLHGVAGLRSAVEIGHLPRNTD